MDYIRRTYGVPAKRGGRVAWRTAVMQRRMTGVITSARGAYIMVRPDGQRRPLTLHPTWNIEYLPMK